jgi:hypothetical protein
VLEQAAIPYMLTGSIVSSLQGEPRSTHDIDIVVEISADQVQAIRAAFPSDHFAFDEQAARAAIAMRDMFQLWEFATGDKVDFWILKDDPFDRNVFDRRNRDTVLGVTAFMLRPEDTILRKLKWAQEFESDRQYRDALGVYEVQHGKLDMAYLQQWVQALGLEPVWQQMLAEAEPLDE